MVLPDFLLTYRAITHVGINAQITNTSSASLCPSNFLQRPRLDLLGKSIPSRKLVTRPITRAAKRSANVRLASQDTEM